jgi:hypothetical protein
MGKYTYTIFDASPQSSSGTEWPTHSDVAVEADSNEEAIEEVRDEMAGEAKGLNPSDGYSVGEDIHAIVWDEDGTIVGQPTYELTYDDLGLTEPKSREEAIAWAREAEEGDCLCEWEDDGLDADSDPGSRGGYGDETLDEVERVLRERDLTLSATDVGLEVCARGD